MSTYTLTLGVHGRKNSLQRSVLVALAILAGLVAAAAPLFVYKMAHAASSTVVVTPTNQQGWSTADTRPGGAVNFISDSTAPAGSGALQLTTDATTAAKAQYMHAANTPLSNVTDLSYYTKQVSGPPEAAPSYQLPVWLDGTAASYTTLVYEPYENGTVLPGTWQSWDVAQGQFWSSRTVTTSNPSCATVAGFGGAPFYNLAALKVACPNAVVVGFGVNVGTYNPSYNVETDLVKFNDTTYDFEPSLTPSNKDACKNGGWQNFNSPAFKNQGQCVSYTEKH